MLTTRSRLEHVDLDERGLRAFYGVAAATPIQRLEYVPYSRFVLAQQLDDAAGGGLGKRVRALVHDRARGGFTLAGGEASSDDYVRLATAVAHLLGPANHDAMSGTYYARFAVRHEDASDSYLRQAHVALTLHTDGTYVDEPTDWLLMMKLAERSARGGETRVLHLDDWKELDAFATHPLASHHYRYHAPPSKNAPAAVRRPTFFEHEGRPCIAYIDQFAQPETLEQGLYLDALTRSLEASAGVATVSLEPGTMIVLNNAFWLHGRAAFEPDPELFRELLRARGRF
ncbi:MAG: carbon starvation induced protein CsiD [Candidatus Eremiobacteraeota bacterium]|nr:carbon starvation induced protein CsiD [Candidatus Eremiobacteraeota bacterium]